MGAALLLSLGFRPTWLAPELVWRLAAAVSLAMADAAEWVAGLADGTVRLKWPNDLVVDIGALRSIAWRDLDTGGEVRGFDVRKLGGVLGETAGLGTDDPRVVVGIGINAGWQPRDFPPDLAATMTSLADASAGLPIDVSVLLGDFQTRLEERVGRLREDRFDVGEWAARQLTTGELVELHGPDGNVAIVRAIGVDPRSGALVVEDRGLERAIHVGEIRHVRFPLAGMGV